jgi:hypothetical protein
MRQAHTKEKAMLAPFTIEPIALAARSVHRIEGAAGVTVSCERGAVWITQENDWRDLVLVAGEATLLDRPGLALVYALKDAAAITIGDTGHAHARDRARNRAGAYA